VVKIIVAGAGGRMGQAILQLAAADPQVKIAGAFEKSDHPSIGRDVGELLGRRSMRVPIHPDLRECIRHGQVMIDFTDPTCTYQNLKLASEYGTAMVIGTTGLTDTVKKAIKSASKKIPIVQSPNMSVGVNLLFKLAQLTASILDPTYDIEIVEAHHRHKKDAPSGTALELVRQIAEARKVLIEDKVIYGRHGETGARPSGTIGVHALRGGDIVGDHIVSFMTEGEKIEISHRATSRNAFAKGAIQAAKFLAKKRPGTYNMQQVLGL